MAVVVVKKSGGEKMINSFYKVGTKEIDPNLFDKKANEIANILCGLDERGNRVGVSSTQMRKIFDEVKQHERIIEVADNQSTEWANKLPYVKMIKSKVAYLVARKMKEKKNYSYYEKLGKFVSEGIDLVNSYEEYKIFVSLFEAVYGYYYELAPDTSK